MNSSQNKRLHYLLNKLDAVAYKADLVWHASEGRTMHSSELLDSEAETLIVYLDKKVKEHTGAAGLQAKVDPIMDKLRKRLISMFVEMGVIEVKTGKADMKTIYRMVREFWKTHLNEMDQDQLSKVIAVVEKKWLPWYYKKRQDPNFKGLGVQLPDEAH